MTWLDKAVPPHQRLQPWFVPTETPENVIKERLALLRATLDDQWLPDVDLRSVMDGTIDTNHRDLPDWIYHARAVATMPALPDTFIEGEGLQRSVATLLSPIVHRGRLLLDEWTPHGPVTISEAARYAMLRALTSRAMTACLPVLEPYVLAYRDACVAMGMPADSVVAVDSDTWTDLYTRHEALPYIVGTVLDHWFSATIEFIQRLQDDAAELIHLMRDTAKVTILENVSMDAGDVHDGGRAVILCTVDGGRRLAYKPKDLRIVEHVQMLSHAINTAAGTQLLHTREILLREGYAWEEFVAAGPCESKDDVETFYHRYGMMARFYELLEARDLWLDNIVACGPWPVVIDLEMVLQPSFSVPKEISAADRLAQHILDESVLPTGLISMPFAIVPGTPPEDMGGLTPIRPFRTPFSKNETLWGSKEAGERVTFEHHEYTPVLDGEFVRVQDYHDAVIQGYQVMDSLLATTCRDVVLQWTETLPRGLPVRSIHRDTWSCLQILHASVSPNALRTVFHRERFLARLLEAARIRMAPSSVEADIVRADVEQLRQLDVPLFVAAIDADTVATASGRSLGRLFDGSAVERLRSRVRRPIDATIRTDILRAALSIGAGGSITSSAAHAPLEHPVDVISTVAHHLSDLAIREADGSVAWIGCVWHATAQSWSLEVLRPSPNGSLALAKALAQAYCLTGTDSWRDLAQSIVLRAHEEIRLADLGEHLPWHHDSEEGLEAIKQCLAVVQNLLQCIPSNNPAGGSDVRIHVHGDLPHRFCLVNPNGLTSLAAMAYHACMNTVQ